MSGHGTVSPFRQPKAVFAVAFACVVSFMGIGLVDPILPSISHQLHASPSEVTLLFTSYLVVTAVAMLITNWVSSRIGAKRTLIAGLILIVAFSALAGASPSISAHHRLPGRLGRRQRAVHRDLAGRHRGLGQRRLLRRHRAVRDGARPRHRGRPAARRRAGRDQLARAVLRRLRAHGHRADRHHHAGQADAVAGEEDQPVCAAAGAAAPRAAHHVADRALLQLGLLHRARLRAVPDEPEPDQARPGVHRLGHHGRHLRRLRRAAAAGPVRHRPDHVRQPGRVRRSSSWSSRSGPPTAPC